MPANPVFPELLPGGPIRRGLRVSVHLAPVPAASRGDVRPGPGRRTLLRASYARFADELGSATVVSINAFPESPRSTTRGRTPTGTAASSRREIDLFRARLSGAASIRTIRPPRSRSTRSRRTTRRPRPTNSSSAWSERSLPTSRVSLAYTYRVLRDLEFSPLIGTTRASYQYVGNATGTAVDPETGFVLNFSEPYYGLTECPPPCVGTVLENRPDASETYSGFELQLLKSFSHGWMARVSFGYNNSQQHIGPGAIVDPNNEVPGTNASGPVVEGG